MHPCCTLIFLNLQIGLSHGNVGAVMDLADRLQMPCLLDAVKEFLISKLRIDNAIDCLLL